MILTRSRVGKAKMEKQERDSRNASCHQGCGEWRSGRSQRWLPVSDSYEWLIEAPLSERRNTNKEHLWGKDRLKCQWYTEVNFRTSFQIYGSSLHMSLRLKFGISLYILRIYQGCPTFRHLWATLEEEELSWATH